MTTFETNPPAAQREPVWLASLEEAMPWARYWNCPLVAFFVAEWCEWSGRLFAETVTDPRAHAILRCVVCTRVEGDDHLGLVEHFGVDVYPTAVVLASDGTELGRIRGFEEGRAWATRLHQILMSGQRAAQAR